MGSFSFVIEERGSRENVVMGEKIYVGTTGKFYRGKYLDYGLLDYSEKQDGSKEIDLYAIEGIMDEQRLDFYEAVKFEQSIVEVNPDLHQLYRVIGIKYTEKKGRESFKNIKIVWSPSRFDVTTNRDDPEQGFHKWSGNTDNEVPKRRI